MSDDQNDGAQFSERRPAVEADRAAGARGRCWRSSSSRTATSAASSSSGSTATGRCGPVIGISVAARRRPRPAGRPGTGGGRGGAGTPVDGRSVRSRSSRPTASRSPSTSCAGDTTAPPLLISHATGFCGHAYAPLAERARPIASTASPLDHRGHGATIAAARLGGRRGRRLAPIRRRHARRGAGDRARRAAWSASATRWAARRC